MAEQRFRLLRTLKIGTFHIGSAFTDILGSAVWNRVLISELGVPSTPVALLSALRYLLAPLSIWAGYRSDTRPIFGMRRLPYIWLGRAFMLLSLPLLPIATVAIAGNTRSLFGWFIAFLSFLFYGIGTLLSGGPFLALVRDSAPPSKRGVALSVVQTVLVASFALSPAIYARMMPSYDPALFWRTVLVGGGVALFFWIVSIVGEEPRVSGPAEEHIPFGQLLRETWADPRTRAFFLFLALGAISAFAQDAILEPFGADLFGFSVGETTRFNAYWGSGVLLSMIGTTVITRKRPPSEQTATTIIGLVLSAVPLAVLTYIAVTRAEWLIIPTLVAFGLGFGIYTIGAVSLLAAMTADRRAGVYLGLWSVAQLVFRGVGISLGGAIRDLALWSTGAPGFAYGIVFLLEAFGLLGCILLLLQVDVKGFVGDHAVESEISPLALADT